mgnify:FL=1
MKFSTVFIIFLGLALGNFVFGAYVDDMPRAIDRTFMQFVFLVSIFIVWKTEGANDLT